MTLDRGWDFAVPDVPRWIEVRSMLLRGDATVIGSPDGALVIDRGREIAGVVGVPGKDVLEEGVSLLTHDAELLVVPETIEHVRSMIPSCVPQLAILHRLTSWRDRPVPPDVEIHEYDDGFLEHLPPDLASEADGAWLAAIRFVAGGVVSMCTAGSVTETLWDVGIDTVEGYQRQGHATACFLALHERMMSVGRTPVWGALDDNVASLAMAESLGFEPVDELWVVGLASPPEHLHDR